MSNFFSPQFHALQGLHLALENPGTHLGMHSPWELRS
jgi:hypothetical protein